MAAISGGRANNERVKCLRIFAETYMEDIDIDLQPRKLFKDNLRCVLRITSQPRGIMFSMSQRVWGKRVGTIRRSDCLCSG